MSSSYEWSLIKLGDLVEGHRGVSYQPHHLLSDHSHDAVVLLRANNIQNGRLVFSDIQVVPEAIVKTDQLLAFGDMAVCMSNGSKSLVGKSAQYKGSLSGNVAVGAFCSIFRPKQEADSGYIKQIFHSAIYQAHIDYSLAGSAINNLKNSDIESLELMVPPKFIQQKIARILQVIDKAIEKTEALIGKYQQIKAGLMHDLFTRGIGPGGKLRPPREQAPELYHETPIGWMPKEWKLRVLNELAAPYKGSTVIGPFGSDLVMSDYQTEGVPVVFVRDVKESGFNWVSNVFVSERKAQRLFSHRVNGEDVLATKMGLPPCVSAVYPSDMPMGIITADIIRMTVDTDKVDAHWLSLSINHDHVKRQVAAITAGVTRAKVTLSDFRRLKIATPPLHEQREIKAILGRHAKLLGSENMRKENLQKQKSGLMHDLLTGKVSVQFDRELTVEAADVSSRNLDPLIR